MNSDDRFLDALEDYLHASDGDTPLPARVRVAVRAQVPVTRQAQAGPGRGRMSVMLTSLSAPAHLGVAAAAIIAVMVLAGAAIGLLGSVGAPTAQPSAPASLVPAPTLTPTPAVSPSAGVAIVDLGQAPPAPCFPDDTGTTCVPAGRYAFNPGAFPVEVTIDVPEGWWPYLPGNGVQGVLVGPESPVASGWGIELSIVGDVALDPCDPAVGRVPATTPEALAEIMATWPGYTVTAGPEPVELGGAAGVRLTLESTILAADCPAVADGGEAVIWTTPAGTPMDAYPLLGEPGAHAAQYWILDVRGAVMVVLATDFPQSSPFEEQQGVTDPQRHAGEHQAELRAMLRSIRFGEPATVE